MSQDKYARNLTLLEKHHPDIFANIYNCTCNSPGEPAICENGLVTLRLFKEDGSELFAYNISDPWKDTDVHMQTVPEGADGVAVLVGMGLGYGALRVFRERPGLMKMVVVEPLPEMFRAAMEHVDLSELFLSEKVEFVAGSFQDAELEQKLGRHARTGDIYILRHVPSFDWRPELYQSVDKAVFELVNKLSASGGTTTRYGARHLANRLKNYSMLRHVLSVGALKDAFQGVPVALVAAGPSLDSSMPFLKKMRDNYLMIAVDSALAPLRAHGLVPDIVTSVDYQDANFEKIVPFLGEELPYLLVVSPKTTPLIPKRSGAGRLMYAFQHDISQAVAINALGVDTLLPASSTVSNMALNVALLTGCDPVIFFGQDLSYPDDSNASDHAANTVIHNSGLPDEFDIHFAEGRDGKQLPTERGMLVEKKMFEEIIARYPERNFLNATVSGLRLENVPFVDEEELSSLLSVRQDIKSELDKILSDASRCDVSRFVRAYREIRDTGCKVAVKIRKKRRMQAELVKLIDRLGPGYDRVSSIDDMPGKVRKLVLKIDKQNNMLDRYDILWNELVDITFSALKENDLAVGENRKLLAERGYREWLRAEMLRFDSIDRTRLDALTFYNDRLQETLDCLECEQEFMDVQGDPAVSCLLAGCHVRAGNVMLASRLANSVHGEECLFAKAVSSILLYDFDNGYSMLRRAELSERERKTLERLVSGECDIWVEAISDYGPRCPALIDVWLERIHRLCDRDDSRSVGYFRRAWKDIAPALEKLEKKGLAEKALEIAGKWRRCMEQVPDAAVFAGNAALVLDRLEKVVEYFSIVAAVRPDNADVMRKLSRALFETGDFSRGIAVLRQAVSLDRNAALVWEELGDAMFEAGNMEDAIECYEQCFLALPDHLEALLKMGDCYLKKGEFEAALEAYRVVAARHPEDSMVQARIRKTEELAG